MKYWSLASNMILFATMIQGFKKLNEGQQKTLLFLFRYFLLGLFMSAVFCVLLLYFNIGGLWNMVNESSFGWVAVIKLYLSMSITLCSVSMGWGVFTLPEKADE